MESTETSPVEGAPGTPGQPDALAEHPADPPVNTIRAPRGLDSLGRPKGAGRPRNPKNYDADGKLLPREVREARRKAEREERIAKGLPVFPNPPITPKPSLNYSPEEKLARRKVMLARRLTGSYIKDIAKEFHCSKSSVAKELKEARHSGLLQKATDFMAAELMPKALAVYAKALDEGDVDVATHVLEGVGVIGKNGPGVQVNIAQASAAALEPFEQWRLSLAKRRGLLGAGTATVIDVGPANDQPAGAAAGSAPRGGGHGGLSGAGPDAEGEAASGTRGSEEDAA